MPSQINTCKIISLHKIVVFLCARVKSHTKGLQLTRAIIQAYNTAMPQTNQKILKYNYLSGLCITQSNTHLTLSKCCSFFGHQTLEGQVRVASDHTTSFQRFHECRHQDLTTAREIIGLGYS